ncbi:hypothetical protein PQX77_006951 [Marasmius sp. AFHP31]|nr:hypothetical protein PQX77_006951 [Marasmius sp. AFHP31]
MGQPKLDSSLSLTATNAKDEKSQLQETEVLKLGVYEVTIEKRIPFLQSFTPRRVLELKENWVKTFLIVKSVLSEVITLQPVLLMALVGLRIWEDLQEVVTLSQETRMLTVIENGLKHGSVDTGAVLSALGIRFACAVLGSYITDRCRDFRPAFNAVIDRHYEDMIMKAKLNMDLPALQGMPSSF